jgi:hypothetical protein
MTLWETAVLRKYFLEKLIHIAEAVSSLPLSPGLYCLSAHWLNVHPSAPVSFSSQRLFLTPRVLSAYPWGRLEVLGNQHHLPSSPQSMVDEN